MPRITAVAPEAVISPVKEISSCHHRPTESASSRMAIVNRSRIRAGEPDAAALFAELAAGRPDDPCTRLHIRRLEHGEAGVKMVMSEK